jgi:hypothetical protein
MVIEYVRLAPLATGSGASVIEMDTSAERGGAPQPGKLKEPIRVCHPVELLVG